ncbi:hypothetical protein V8C43DRAFT_304647 [Trichoderma afarasin]
MASPHDGNKDQIIKSLSAAAYVLDSTAESWAKIQEISGLPQALYVVGKTLPNLPILLTSLESSIKNSEETKEVKDKYAAATQFAELAKQQATYFKLIYDAVKSSDSYDKAKVYRAVAKKNGGTAIETIMKDLLQRAKVLAAALITDEDLKSRLEEAYEEVAEVEPSLVEDPKGQVYIKNYGPGNQFYHGGAGGNQNHCSGGHQYTGDGYTINHK